MKGLGVNRTKSIEVRIDATKADGMRKTLVLAAGYIRGLREENESPSERKRHEDAAKLLGELDDRSIDLFRTLHKKCGL